MFNLTNKKIVAIVMMLPLFICLQILPGFAAGQQPIANSSLEQQVQALAAQLQALQAQLASQKQVIESNANSLNENKRDLSRNRKHLQEQNNKIEESISRQDGITNFAKRLQTINEHVKISGLVEVEAGFSKDFDDNNTSDLTLATAALDFDVNLHRYVSAHLLFLWEEDDTEPVDLDEGYIMLGNTEFFPVYFQVGKLYVPFGNFESNMISDPLTLEMGEARESAAVLGAESNGFCGAVYAFNGDVNESGSDDGIKCFGLNAGYAFENDNFSFDIGAGWINSIAAGDNLADTLPGEIEDYVAGYTAHATFNLSGFTLIGEYLAAADDFEASELAWKSGGAQPKSWNLEAAYTFAIVGHETVLALAWQSTEEALALELPEDRFVGTVSVGIIDGLSLSIEYAHDEDYSKSDGGTGNNADIITTQLSLEF